MCRTSLFRIVLVLAFSYSATCSAAGGVAEAQKKAMEIQKAEEAANKFFDRTLDRLRLRTRGITALLHKKLAKEGVTFDSPSKAVAALNKFDKDFIGGLNRYKLLESKGSLGEVQQCNFIGCEVWSLFQISGGPHFHMSPMLRHPSEQLLERNLTNCTVELDMRLNDTEKLEPTFDCNSFLAGNLDDQIAEQAETIIAEFLTPAVR